MKKITLLAALFAGFTMSAQVTIYSEDFSSEDLSDWDLYDEDGDGNNWGDMFVVTDADQNPVTPVSLISRSWQSFPLFPDNWAVTPAIDLTEVSGTIELSWQVMAAAAAWDNEHYSVYAASSNDIVELEMSDVTFSETYDDPNNEGTLYDRTLDLSSLAGETIYIAFRHHDVSDMDYISISNLLVTADALSTNDEVFQDFNYFVANNQLNLSAKTAMNNVSVYNMLGQEVISQKLNNMNESLSISALKTGVYVVTVTIEGANQTFKIVKN